MKQPYNTALYMRLSRDDETYGDSISIETQRTILWQYARENGFHVVDEYVDDGWSGTNFDRPSFKRMMEDVDAGKINCIITKDLSRFGREHVMMGYYLEFVFPEKKIRYIAVSENEDTEKGLSDFVPFKNLFNEWFAKDTSRKVKAAFHAKHAAGERTASIAPLGYIRHPEIHNTLAIDEEHRWIVEKIFDLAAHGAGPTRIANQLTREKVPTPGWLNYQRYGYHANAYQGQPEDKAFAWSVDQVKKILSDETYIGNSIHNKQIQISYKNRKRVRNPEDKWFRVENTHEAIISKDVFQQVQTQIVYRRRRMKNAQTQIFAGLVRCSDCGWSMSFGTNRHTKTPYSYFNCSTYRKLSKSQDQCSCHYIRYDYLYLYILSRIQYWAKRAQTDEKKLLADLRKNNDKEAASLYKKQNAELAKAEKRKAELDRLFAKLYEDWVSDRITVNNFNMMTAKYQAEQQELMKRIDQLKKEKSTQKQTTVDAEKWVALIRQYTDPKELTAELLNTLIEKIVIHEAVKDEDGMREQEVEVYYRFIGKIE